ncbi:MAG: hypothetical protein ACPGXK_09800 [Phycisphaerae bacterium]
MHVFGSCRVALFAVLLGAVAVPAAFGQSCPDPDPVESCANEFDFGTNSCCAEVTDPTCLDFTGCGIQGGRLCDQSLTVCTDDGDCPGGESCCDAGDINPAFDCRWRPIADAIMNNTCDNLADPVSRRMCNLNILLDGDLNDGLAVGAEKIVDLVPDQGGVLPGICGDSEEPLFAGQPSGLNIAHSVLYFSPDSDPDDNEDDSFIYIGFDIADFPGADGQVPVPFDLDFDGSACGLTENVFNNIRLYQAFVQSCADTSVDDLCFESPRDIDSISGRDLQITYFDPFAAPLVANTVGGCSPNASSIEISTFPTADGVTNGSLACIDNELCHCANRSNGDGNNVELVIRQAETSGVFGMHQVALPDSPEARDNRLALGQLFVTLFGGAVAADADEDLANIQLRTPIPAIEVEKTVSCTDRPNTVMPGEDPLAIFPGEEIEFEITIRNTGNDDLEVTVNDLLESIGPLGVTCDAQCDSLQAFLTSPRRGLVNEPVNAANAGSFDLEAAFFFNNDPCTPVPGAFLPNLGTPAMLGTLLGATVERSGDTCDELACTITDGDSIVIRFLATVNADQDAVCENQGTNDCQNTVEVTAQGTNDSVMDSSGPVIIDAVCRDIDLDKQVAVDGGQFQDGPVQISGGTSELTYRLSTSNNGEVTENITISDDCICAAVNNTAGVNFGACDFCTVSNGSQAFLLGPGQNASVDCTITFDDAAAVQAFVLSDDADGGCCPNDDPNDETTCHCNRVTGSAVVIDPDNDVCGDPDPLTAEDQVTVCNRVCEIDVTKQVRCLPNCTDAGLGAEEGWVDDPNELEVTPGACIQYRVILENTSDTLALCAVKISDVVLNADNFMGAPFMCEVEPAQCGDLCPTDFLATERSCNLPSALQPGETVTIRYKAQLSPNADPAELIVNTVTGFGAVETDCQANPDDPQFTCMDDDSATVDIQECDYSLDKWVACEEPRLGNGQLNPAAIWKDSAETIPGARVSYRFEMCNNGDTDLVNVQLTDTLSCDAWLVGGSVIADIDGVVNNCIDSLDDLNGTPTSCPALAPGSCLNVTLEVEVPANFNTVNTPVDCTNEIASSADPNICSGDNACPDLDASASFNVLIPGIDCDKTVCEDMNGDGQCDPGLERLVFDCDETYPVNICFNVDVTNNGETQLENVQACDPDLVADLMAILGPQGMLTCDFDAVTGCADINPLDPGASAMVSCCFEVTEEELEMLAAADLVPDDDCYDNVVTSRGDAAVECVRGADRERTATCDTQVCRTPDCMTEVDKQVRCIENCTNRTPEGQLVDSLPATPGATVEFVTSITNNGESDICALDIGSNFAGNFTPTDCAGEVCRLQLQQMGGGTVNCTLPPNYNGGPLSIAQACGGQILDIGDTLILSCAYELPDNASGQVTCTTSVDCASDGGCVGNNPADFTYCANQDMDDADVTIETCDFTVDKSVTCDEARLQNGTINPGATFGDTVEALPGSDVYFRIEVCNTGQTDLVNLQIDDNLGCNWPSSEVVADVNGVLTNCINSLNDLNGQPLAACPAIPPGQCMNITFKVTVPAGFNQIGVTPDCVNNVTVNGDPDVCSDDDACPERADAASIDVRVPNKFCTKGICAGNGCTGTSTDLQLDSDVPFPLVLRFQNRVVNNGETDLTNVQICDPILRSAILGSPVATGADCNDLINSATGCIDLPNLAPGQAEERFCTVTFPDVNAWNTFELFTGGDDECFDNTSNSSGDVVSGSDVCVPDPQNPLTDSCFARVCIDVVACPPGGDCTPTTKATVEVWNQNEDFFSGTHRCIESWDQVYISEFASGINQFWRSQLQTDKGKARIIGEKANFCDPAFCCERGDDNCFRIYAIEHNGDRAPECSITAPMLGVAVKELMFGANGLGLAGETLRGGGIADGQLLFETLDEPEPAVDGPPSQESDKRTPVDGRSVVDKGEGGSGGGLGDVVGPEAAVAAAPGAPVRATTSRKGSLLVFPNVEVKFDSQGNVIQDTYISLTNDYIEDVSVKLYFVHGDCCLWADRAITLTANESTYWSVLTGDPKNVTPFTAVGPALPDPDDRDGDGVRRLAGYILAWAEEEGTGREINWNHLEGTATTVHFGDMAAWEYPAWAFEAIAGDTPGSLLLPPYGQIDMDGTEYANVPGQLLFDFFSPGTQLPGLAPFGIDVDTDLTLWVAVKDLRAQ